MSQSYYPSPYTVAYGSIVERLGELAGALNIGTPASGAWPAANLALYIPISIPLPTIVTKFFWELGAGVADNSDIGLFDWSGRKLVSTGSTAHSGSAGDKQITTLSSSVFLQPGTYWLGISHDTNTTGFQRWNPTATLLEIFGLREESSAFALPSTATLTTATTRAYLPAIGFE